MTSRFCEICNNLSGKIPAANFQIVFSCPTCLHTENGDPAVDSLFYELPLETKRGENRDELLEDAHRDKARNIVKMDCKKCNLNYLNLSRVGENETTYLSCECGYVATYSEHLKG